MTTPLLSAGAPRNHATARTALDEQGYAVGGFNFELGEAAVADRGERVAEVVPFLFAELVTDFLRLMNNKKKIGWLVRVSYSQICTVFSKLLRPTLSSLRARHL